MIQAPQYAILRRDMWSFVGQADAICITTNGSVKKNGRAVMGRGVAADARTRYPGVDAILASCIRLDGNRVNVLYPNITPHGEYHPKKTALLSFPTKTDKASLKTEDDLKEVLPQYVPEVHIGSDAPGWMLRSSLEIIEQSCIQLREIADKNNWELLILPMPGCANGGLAWNQVEPIVRNHLDSRFIIVHR